MSTGESNTSDVAREAYEQSLYGDIVSELLNEREMRQIVEETLNETMDSALVTARALFRHKEIVRQQNKVVIDLQTEIKKDPLTGLLEKTAWMEEVETAVAQGKQFGVIYIDLTNFKWVNDNISHDRGDHILMDFAGMLSSATRSANEDTDMVLIDTAPIPDNDYWAGRLGGDEFAILIDLTPRTDFEMSNEQRLSVVIDRLKQLCNQFLENEEELAKGGFDFAIGGAVWQSGESSSSIIMRAEQAMYDEKRNQHSLKGQYR